MRKSELNIKSLLLAVFLIFSSLGGWSQEISATLEFLEDSMAVGKPVALRMAIKHPSDVVVVFPEARDFSPFELISSAPEPTETLDGFSWDVVVYTVRSFILEDKQSLKLPYAYYEGKDTLRRFIRTDSIQLNRRVKGGEDRDKFIMQDGLESLEDPLNYFRIFLLVSGVLSLLLGFLLLLRKPIRRYLIIRRNRLEWMSFKRQLRDLENLADQPKLFDRLTQLWKGFLDPEDINGYRSMTTTEFKEALLENSQFTLEQQQVLVEAAQLADKSVYAGERIQPHQITNILVQIKNVMAHVYAERAKELKKRKT